MFATTVQPAGPRIDRPSPAAISTPPSAAAHDRVRHQQQAPGRHRHHAEPEQHVHQQRARVRPAQPRQPVVLRRRDGAFAQQASLRSNVTFTAASPCTDGGLPTSATRAGVGAGTANLLNVVRRKAYDERNRRCKR